MTVEVEVHGRRFKAQEVSAVLKREGQVVSTKPATFARRRRRAKSLFCFHSRSDRSFRLHRFGSSVPR